MTAVRRILFYAGLAAALTLGGCHELQPHRLQRWNRGPGMPTGPEAYSLVAVGSDAV